MAPPRPSSPPCSSCSSRSRSCAWTGDAPGRGRLRDRPGHPQGDEARLRGRSGAMAVPDQGRGRTAGPTTGCVCCSTPAARRDADFVMVTTVREPRSRRVQVQVLGGPADRGELRRGSVPRVVGRGAERPRSNRGDPLEGRRAGRARSHRGDGSRPGRRLVPLITPLTTSPPFITKGTSSSTVTSSSGSPSTAIRSA